MCSIILDEYNQKEGLRAVLDNGTFQDILAYLLDYLISSIPLVGSSLSFAFNVGSIIYDYMSSLDVILYRQKKVEIENTNQYIIGKHYFYLDYPPIDLPTDDYYDFDLTGDYIKYSVGSGIYYGADYQRGQFIEIFLKNN